MQSSIVIEGSPVLGEKRHTNFLREVIYLLNFEAKVAEKEHKKAG